MPPEDRASEQRRHVFAALVGFCGLALYLWPALRAPVVQWSDSRTDLAWAREGVGIFRPAQESGHAAKPAYLLFLRAVLSLVPPAAGPRAIVIAQSLFLWAAITLVAWRLGRRHPWLGVTTYGVLVCFFRLRDTASSIMPEALAAGLLLLVVSFLLHPFRGRTGAFFLGVLIALLGVVRPNVGAFALVLAIGIIGVRRAWIPLALVVLGLLLVGVPLALLRSGHGQSRLNGLSFTILEGSADYYWVPSLGPLPAGASARDRESRELHRARGRWQEFLSQRGIDARRQLLWRSLHGLLGVEFYNAQWSPGYWWLTTVSRLASPFLILCCMAVVLAAPWRGDDRGWRVAAALLLLMLVGQDLLLGSNPRFVLPLLPVLLLLGTVGAFQPGWRTPSVLTSGAIFAVFLLAVLWARGVVDWQWGRIEAPGVVLRQEIPRSKLARGGTLHVRIAPATVPSSAELEMRGPGNQLLYESVDDTRRTQPDIRIRIPEALSRANARGAVEVRLVSRGACDEFNYLLFPVVPPPWGTAAVREGSNVLSPGTGVRFGGLDWWAHEGWP
jgi:hypothetical protein